MEFHKRIKHNEKMCCTQDLRPFTEGQGHNRVKGQIVSLNRVSAKTYILLKLVLWNFTKKLKHNEKMSCGQELSLNAPDQGHNRVRGRIVH